MAISCTLGLTACLMYGGNDIPAEDVFHAIDTCEFVSTSRNMSAVSLSGSADDLEESLDILLRWSLNATAAERRRVILIECQKLNTAFATKSMWKNLDKWPR